MTSSVHIVMLLDESGSMAKNKDEMVQSINTFIVDQKQETKRLSLPEPVFTLMKFNDKINTVINKASLNDVIFTSRDYTPNGLTSIYDAMGEVFNKFGDEKNVVLVIITDGEDTSSKTYKYTQIKGIIDTYKNNTDYNWRIIYLASDPFVAKQGADLGLQGDNMDTLCADFSSLSTTGSIPLSRVVSSFRQSNTMRNTSSGSSNMSTSSICSQF